MRIGRTRRVLDIDGTRLALRRTTGGVVELWAEDDLELATGLGFAHAHDRMVQLMLTRLIGQGRLGECLKSDPQTEAIDIFMRDLGLRHDAEREVSSCAPRALCFGEAYAKGINTYLKRHRRPLELKLVGYRPEPWTVADTLLTIKLMSYVGLAQTQQDMEKLIVQAIHGGADVERLKRLFAPHLDGLDDELVGFIRRLHHVEPLVPPELRFVSALPALMGSNNWAVAPSRSTSGHALQCNDPHLECNRLPAIWYEAVMHTADDYRIGATMPGVPGVVMGRTGALSFGFNYGFMDMIDYFIEDCRGGRCRRGGGFETVQSRRETVLRRGKSPIEIVIRSTDRGVLEADPRCSELEDGLYLARAWSGAGRGAAASLEALLAALDARTVGEAQQVLRRVTISCNWVLADRDGNIAYQQSGMLPARRHSGLHPVPGWDPDLAWSGTVPADQLLSFANPPEGFIATANDELNPPGGPLVINLPMGPYRVERIRALLGGDQPLAIEDMKRIQLDLYSIQAERFMDLLRPHLPDTPAGRLLAEWDLCYDIRSCAATLFEDIYHGLLRRVFGEGLFGGEVWEAIAAATAVCTVYFHFFDQALLGDEPAWYEPEGRDAVVAAVVQSALDGIDPDLIPTWGERRQVMMINIFFAGTLPRWLGFDHGPVRLPGCRATVVQGGIFSAHGRQTTFAPSYRYVTDLGSDRVDTVLAGGPSGRRWSRWYRSDVERWLTGGYKTLGVATSEG